MALATRPMRTLVPARPLVAVNDDARDPWPGGWAGPALPPGVRRILRIGATDGCHGMGGLLATGAPAPRLVTAGAPWPDDPMVATLLELMACYALWTGFSGTARLLTTVHPSRESPAAVRGRVDYRLDVRRLRRSDGLVVADGAIACSGHPWLTVTRVAMLVAG